MCITSIFHQEDFIINTNKLQYFISVYEEGSITAAAKKHYVTQVAMSQQIASLEEELGIKLFLRKKTIYARPVPDISFMKKLKRFLNRMTIFLLMYVIMLTITKNYCVSALIITVFMNLSNPIFVSLRPSTMILL